MKKNKLMILAVVIIAVFFAYKYWQNKKSKEIGSTSTGVSSPTTRPAVEPVNPSKTLSKGDSGESVKELQRQLNKVMIRYTSNQLTVDGDFGTKTESAMNVILKKKSGSINEVKAKSTTRPPASIASTLTTGATTGATTAVEQGATSWYNTVLDYTDPFGWFN